MSITYSSVDGWSGDPPLSDVPASFDLRCPECDAPVLHIQPYIYEPPVSNTGYGVCRLDAPYLVAWLLIPCAHEVSARTHVLFFTTETAEFRIKKQGDEGS